MLMDPDQRRIDEDVFEIWILGQVLENPLPHVLLRPPPEARVDGVPFAKFVRQIAPRRNLSEPPTAPLPQTDDCRLRCVPDHRTSLAVQVQSGPIGRRSLPCESRLTSIFQP